MTKLSELQCLLLSHASQRDDGAMAPYPASVDPRGAIKALGALVRKGLAEERAGEGGAMLSFITAAGLAAIGVDDGASGALPSLDLEEEVTATPITLRQSKPALVLDLMQREGGATIADMIAVTGWLPHSCRAALTGLRKKGHAVERFSREGVTCYRLGAA